MNVVWGGKSSQQINQAICDFVSMRIWDAKKSFGNFTSMGVVSREKLIAGLIYHNYEPDAGTIEITGAAADRRWLTKPVLYKMYEYPFEQLDCQMVVQRNSEHNHHLNSILRRYGFDEYRIERLRGKNEAEIIFTLTKEQWVNNGYHKEHLNG